MAKKKSRNVWKIVAIVCALLFVAVLVTGYMRARRFDNAFRATTPDDAALAQSVIAGVLEANGERIADYDVRIMDKVRKVDKEDVSTEILHVSLVNDAVTQAYIIDLSSGQVLMHSETERYGWMRESKLLPFADHPWSGKPRR